MSVTNNIMPETYADVKAPWSGLGTPVNNDMTAQQMLIASGCDWRVEKFPNIIRIGGSDLYTGTEALVRMSDNKVLSANVGPEWEPLQNSEAFDFFEQFVKEGKMTMETAGSLRGGLVVWALAKVGKAFDIFKGDVVESYLLFSCSHEYGRATVVDFTPIRVACWNTLKMALSNKTNKAAVVNHRAKFEPTKVQELLGIADSKFSDFKEQSQFLGSKKATDEQVLEFLKETWPVISKGKKPASKSISKLAKQAFDLYPNQPGSEYATGTWWQAFNAVSYMVDHELCRDQDTRLYLSWYGLTRDTKTKAFNRALESAKAA